MIGIPAQAPRPTDPYEDLELAHYVAVELLTGRQLFDVLGDDAIVGVLDETPSPLEHLARDPFVRGALAAVPG